MLTWTFCKADCQQTGMSWTVCFKTKSAILRTYPKSVKSRWTKRLKIIMGISYLFQKIIKMTKNINEKYFLNDLFSFINWIWHAEIIEDIEKFAHAKYELLSASERRQNEKTKSVFEKIVFVGCNSLVLACFKHVLRA